MFRDGNVTLETHVTDTERLIGYTIEEKRTRWRPSRLERPTFLGLFYSNAKDVDMDAIRRPLSVLYHDYNIRLLAFGEEEESRDYMLVLRGKQ